MQNKIIGVVAPKGSGKTTRMAEFVKTCPRVAIYDPMAATDFQYQFVASEIVKADVKTLGRVISQDDFQVLYEPEPPTQDGEEWYYSDFRPFLQWCWRRAQLIGPMTIVVDEAHYTMSKRTMPLEMWNLITNGRRYGLSVCWITQRFVGVNGWVRANADEYWFFRLSHGADLQSVAEICGPDVMEQVRNLRRLDAERSPIIPGQMLKFSTLDGSVIIEEQGVIQENDPKEQGTEVPSTETDGEPIIEVGEGEAPTNDNDRE